MSAKRMWLGAAAMGVGLSGCSGRVNPEKDCVEEFVQEFVLEEPRSMRNRNPVCAGQDIRGATDYPDVRRIIRIEYSEGDFYTTQTLQDWRWKQNPDDLDCDLIEESETVFRVVSLGGRKQYTGMRDGNFLDQGDLGRYYGSTFLFGHGDLPQPAPLREKVAEGSLEPTEFLLDCAVEERHIAQTEKPSKECLPVSPMPNCPAFDMMMPIHLEGYFGRDGVTGKTTVLKFGKAGSIVDKSKWMLP